MTAKLGGANQKFPIFACHSKRHQSIQSIREWISLCCWQTDQKGSGGAQSRWSRKWHVRNCSEKRVQHELTRSVPGKKPLCVALHEERIMSDRKTRPRSKTKLKCLFYEWCCKTWWSHRSSKIGTRQMFTNPYWNHETRTFPQTRLEK